MIDCPWPESCAQTPLARLAQKVAISNGLFMWFHPRVGDDIALVQWPIEFLCDRLAAAGANQYRAFRFDEAGAIRAAFVFIRMDEALADMPAETPPKILSVFRKVQVEERAIVNQMHELERARIVRELKIDPDVPDVPLVPGLPVVPELPEMPEVPAG